MRRARWLLALLGGLAWSCAEPAPEPLANECDSDEDCSARAVCADELGMCVQPSADEPYYVVLQVAGLPTGDGKLARFTAAGFMLEQSRADLDLEVPRGLRLPGAVRGQHAGKAVNVAAQIAFTPVAKAEGLPVSPVIAESRSSKDPAADNLSVILAPDTRYGVSVIPLGKQSEQFPPLTFEVDTNEALERIDLVYPALESFSGLLLDQAGRLQKGRSIRLVDAVTGEVRSSTVEVDGQGHFTLVHTAGALTPGASRFEVDLEPERPWQTVIAIDPSRIDAANDNAITMPAVPERVLFKGSVEKGPDVELGLAEVTFESSFPLPDTPGDVRDRDWCRSQLSDDTRAPFVCRAKVSVSSAADGRFSVELLPGDYRVSLRPLDAPDSATRATTASGTAVIESQPGGAPQQGQTYALASGARYTGFVRDRSLGPIPNVVVGAVALQLVGTFDGDDAAVARLNRTTETVTREDGSFELSVDLGYYDLVARPAGGFPWMYAANRVVTKADKVIMIDGFVIPEPVLLSGHVTSDGVPASGASVDAYAVISDFTAGKRSILVGRATTDETGRYVLAMAPEVILDR